MDKITPFDSTEEFETYVAPRIQELIRVCNQLKIPIFISSCYKNTAKESTYFTDLSGSRSLGFFLKDDYFPDYINIQNGFKTVLPREEEEIPMDIFAEMAQIENIDDEEFDDMLDGELDDEE